MTLATEFYSSFREAFKSACEAKGALKDLWASDPGWTAFMLREHDGVLFLAADKWAQRVGAESYSIKPEWRKFDLMVVSPKWGQGAQWWQSIPILTIEHENGDQIHDEIWNLACWRSQLKVLVTYHNSPKHHVEKLMLAAQILRTLRGEYGPDAAEYLCISAPRPVESGWEWRGDTWTDERGWEALAA